MSYYYPPNHWNSIFNALNYLYGDQTLSLFDAQSQFLSLGGGNLSGSLYLPNLFCSGSITGTLSTNAQPNITSLGTLSSLSVSTYVDAASFRVSGTPLNLAAITGITDGTVSASKAVIVDANKDISSFRNLTATNLTGTLQTAAQPNITSLGTLSSLTVAANACTLAASCYQYYCTLGTNDDNDLVIKRNGSLVAKFSPLGFKVGSSSNAAYPLDVVGDVSLTGSLRNGTTEFMDNAGKLKVAAQTNITSVGTLTALNLSGTQSTANAYSTWTGNATAPTNTNGIGIRFNGMANGGTGYLRAYNYVLAQDNNLSINNDNIYIKNDRKVGIDVASPAYKLDVAAGYVNSVDGYKINGNTVFTSAGLTGTLLTAAQPNITSVGTLTGLTSSGVVICTDVSEATNWNAASIVSAGGIACAKKIWTNSNLLMAGNLGIYNDNPLWRIHMKGLVGQNMWVLFANDSTSASDIYSLGCGSSAMKYNTKTYHKFYTNCLGDGSCTESYSMSANEFIQTSGSITQKMKIEGSWAWVGTSTNTNFNIYQNGLARINITSAIIEHNLPIKIITNAANAFTMTSTIAPIFINQTTTDTNAQMLNCTVSGGKVANLSIASDGLHIDSTDALFLGVSSIAHWKINANGYLTSFNTPTTKRIGIMTTTPQTALDIGSTAGDKLITVWGTTGVNDDNFAIGAKDYFLKLQGPSVALYCASRTNTVGQLALQAHYNGYHGCVSIGANQGTTLFNLMKDNAALRLGKAESTSNSCTIQYNHASDGNLNNSVSFDFYGTTNDLSICQYGCGIGVSSPSIKAGLDIGKYLSFSYTSGKLYNLSTNTYTTVSSSSIDLSLYCAASIWCNSTIMTSSDERLKSNIKTLTIDTEQYKKLRTVSYDKHGHHEIGLIAQEALRDATDIGKEIICAMPNPEMKKENEYDADDGFSWSLQYDRLPIVNMTIIQQLMNKIDHLEKKLELIEKKH